MAEQAEKTEPGLEQVLERLKELEKRIEELEKREALAESLCRSEDRPLQSQDGGIPFEAQGKNPPLQREANPRAHPPRKDIRGAKYAHKPRVGHPATSVVPVVGKAVLGIAGAYLLRAIAESGAVPRWVMLVAGIAYAGVWLVWAARSHPAYAKASAGRRGSRFASLIFGLTAAVILPPLLWEGTVRFQALRAEFASAVLVGAVVLSLGLAWKERLEAIPWIATVAAVGTALALIVATHELRALTTALLAMALVTEAAACCGCWLGLRVVTGLAADFAVGLVALVMTSAGGVPASYRVMSTSEVNSYGVALMVIYSGSVAVRAFVRKRELTFLEVAQAAVAFAVGIWVSLRATQGGSAAALGAVFLVLAMVCYWGALKRFAKGGGEGGKGEEETQDPGSKNEPGAPAADIKVSATLERAMRWNRRVSANYAAGLVLAGSLLLLNGNFQVVALSVAAIAAVAVFTRTKYLSLGIHSTFYLLAAGVACGLFGYTAGAMAGTVPGRPEWGFWVVAVAGLVSYVVGARASGEGWRAGVLWVLPAVVVVGALAALVVAGIAGVGTGELSASRLSMVRTVVTCVMALGLAYAGSRWNRVELGWVAYGAIGLGALKLLVEDLRFGNAGTLMVSLLFYGLVLILLPRVTRFGRVEV